MTWIDWVIVAVLAVSTLGGFLQGAARVAFTLGGLLAGLILAAWNYERLAEFLLPAVRVEQIAGAVAFCVIVLLVMAVSGLIASVLTKAARKLGLGLVNRIAGAIFGFFQGAVLITICILVAVAFFPRAGWLADSRLPKEFFGICRLSTHISPSELTGRMRHGLIDMEEKAPGWMHTGMRKLQ